MRDLKLGAWIAMFPTNELFLKVYRAHPRIPELVPVLFTYNSNCNQVMNAGHFPRAIFNAGRLFQVAESMACQQLGHAPFAFAKVGCLEPPAGVVELRDRIMDWKSPTALDLAVLTETVDLSNGRVPRNFSPEFEVLCSETALVAWTALL